MRCVLFVVAFLPWLLPTHALYADETTQLPSTIKLSVRAIQASDPHDLDAERDESKQRAIHVDSSLEDLQAKLTHLPFNNFRLLSLREELITLKTRDSLQLPRGQTLMFRPIYMEAHKIGLWLNWKDKDGSEILNTRVHFDSKDTVLTGTDCSHNEGLILAIKAMQVVQ